MVTISHLSKKIILKRRRRERHVYFTKDVAAILWGNLPRFVDKFLVSLLLFLSRGSIAMEVAKLLHEDTYYQLFICEPVFSLLDSRNSYLFNDCLRKCRCMNFSLRRLSSGKAHNRYFRNQVLTKAIEIKLLLDKIYDVSPSSDDTYRELRKLQRASNEHPHHHPHQHYTRRRGEDNASDEEN